MEKRLLRAANGKELWRIKFDQVQRGKGTQEADKAKKKS